MNYRIRFFSAVLLASIPFSAPASSTFSSPGLGTHLTSPSDLSLQNIQFTETVQPDSRVEVAISVELQNSTASEWSSATVSLQASEDESFELTDGSLQFGSFSGSTTTSPLPEDDTVAALMDAAEVAAFKSEILAGSHLNISGFESYVFTLEPVAIDKESADLWFQTDADDDGLILVFLNSTDFLASLRPGQLLVADPRIYNPPAPRTEDPFNPQPGGPPPVLSQSLPFEIERVAEVNGEIHVHGEKRELLDVLKSATIQQEADDAFDGSSRPYYDPPLENTYTDAEEKSRSLLAKVIEEADPRDSLLPALKGLTAIPFSFNEVSLTPNLSMSGQVLLRSSGLGIEIKIRDFELKRVALHLDGGLEFNAVLEASTGEDNTDAPPEDQSIELIEVALPPVVLSIAGFPLQFQPVFTAAVGAEIKTPSKVSIPLQSSVLIGVDLGWDESRPAGDRFFYESTQESEPLQLSEPGIFTDEELSAQAHAEIALDIFVGAGGVPSLLGPSSGLVLRTEAELEFDATSELVVKAELDGRAHFNFLGLNVIGGQQTLAEFPIANVPLEPRLAPRKGLRSPSNITDFLPESGRDSRWAHAFQTEVNSGFNDEGFGFITETDDYLLFSVNRISHSMNKFNAEGDLLWSKELDRGRPLGGVPEPGGGFTLTGADNSLIWLASYDQDGNQLWVEAFDPNGLWEYGKFLRSENAAGEAEYFLCGTRIDTLITTGDPFVMKFDASGQLLWTKFYAIPGDEKVHSAIVASDGNLVLCGKTQFDVEAPLGGTPNNDVTLFNITTNFLLLKIGSQAGALQWANSFVSHWGGALNDLVEAPDGSIYACGHVSRPVNVEYPVNLVAHYSASGTLLDHVTIGEDPDTTDQLADSGNTPWDKAAAIEWYNGGLYVAGSTGLGSKTSAWVASMTGELGVRWWTAYDGAHEDRLLDLIPGEAGLIALGSTKSILPWGNGGSGACLAMCLPHEGIMRFHPSSGLDSFYLQPRVFHSSAHADFRVTSTVGLNPPLTQANSTSAIPFVATEMELEQAKGDATLGDVVTIVLESDYRIGDMAAHSIQGYVDWATFHQLPEGMDGEEDNVDSDGRTNGQEFYFGGSPLTFEKNPPQMAVLSEDRDGEPYVVLEFYRSRIADGLDPEVEASTNLQSWFALSPDDIESVPHDDEVDLLRIWVRHGPYRERFFRIYSPE